jgi:hypothetical protein
MKAHNFLGYATIGLATLTSCNQSQDTPDFRPDTPDFYRVAEVQDVGLIGEGDKLCTVNVNYVSFVTARKQGHWVTEPSFEVYDFSWEVDGVVVHNERGLESRVSGELLDGESVCRTYGPLLEETQ